MAARATKPIPVIPEADALAEAIRDLRQVPDSLATACEAGLDFRDDGWSVAPAGGGIRDDG
jgi:hypothetical protein